MVENNSNSIAVKILGQEYKVKCPPDKVAELQESAVYLDHLMQEIRDNSNVFSLDRIAVMAALNTAHDMLILKKQKHAYIDTISKRIQDLQYKIQQTLTADTE